MPLLPLHLLGSPVLRQRSDDVAEVDDGVRELIADLFETMDAAKGVGLAANQVGVARRVAVIDADGHRIALVNPRIVSAEGRATAEEGCLSIPDVYADVTRPERVVLEALDADGKPYRLEVGALAGRAIQHEIDHLDGKLFVDYLSEMKRQRVRKKIEKEKRLRAEGRTAAPAGAPAI